MNMKNIVETAEQKADREENDTERPFYVKGKIVPDARAIANLDALARPKAPPGRAAA